MLNRHNLSIAKLAPKDQGSRYELSAVYVHPDYTAETDGKQLMKVSTGSKAASNGAGDTFPPIGGMDPPVLNWKPFLLSVRSALEIAKALPRKPPLPILQYAAVSAETDNGEQAVLGVSDLHSGNVFRAPKLGGSFPDLYRVIPDRKKASIRIAVDASLLALVLKQIADMCSREGAAYCELSLYGPERAIRIDAKTDEGQDVLAVVMPMRMSPSHDDDDDEVTRNETE